MEGVLISTIFSNIVQVMHQTILVESVGVDLGNFYDVVTHPIASISLQSFRIRQTMMTMILYALQTMKFCLHTGYGQSEWSYGGSKDNPPMDLA